MLTNEYANPTPPDLPVPSDHCTSPDIPTSTTDTETYDISDHPEEECAIFGIYAPGEDAARMTYFGLHALQHRGQQAAGIAISDGKEDVYAYKDKGLVNQVFSESTLKSLEGHIAIGHTRYSAGSPGDSWETAQPHLFAVGDETIGLANNGTFLNTDEVRAKLIERGIEFRTETASEVAAKLIGNITCETNHMREGIREAMQLINGAYCMVLLTQTSLYAFRDPSGFRPLCIGELPEGRGWVVASESCGLDIVGASFVREVEPGEIIRINEEGLISEQAVPARDRAFCIFEYVYIARPDSTIDGLNVYDARERMGRRIAEECPTEADIVIGVPDSGVPSAVGYARASGIPYSDGIVKNRYVGRTFIQPTQALRQLGVRLKLNPLTSIIKDKRLVVVDDSIVRGTTSKQLIQMLRDAGAKEVHMRITSPPVVWPCFYGVDIKTQDQLISATHSIEQVAEAIGADSLAYISLEGLVDCCRTDRSGFCTACFSGEYPLHVPENIQQTSFCGSLKPCFRDNM
ncbi:MAG TPA: amidophosphoribosyltransferase [Coriobacteriia bacterium]|nr:amidophosphoribosyltransferase [Coriobacteriia bacterium]